ncbi:adhesion G-protein coupled receptor D1-like isoform X2 [Pocillopora verrucosa]|uniref:adhesion G-protein coupled receptor D1-like isoform X2 n=1 Tax=Pocillopora verrucosa TaxID=203993 RepID=UPI00334008FE
MMMNRSCQIWGTLLLSSALLSFWVHGNVCNNDVFDLECTNDDYYCHLLDSNASSCTCLGKGCKQTCKSLVQDCEMVLNCSGGDCEQTCSAKTCKLNCKKGHCKKQECYDKRDFCEMNLECSGGDCEQTCNAKTCKLNCSRGQCKKQECHGKRNYCEMKLECSGGDCKQTCNAETCKLNCKKGHCKKQECYDKRDFCEMNLECSGGDCEQTCNAKTCKLNCSRGQCKKQECYDKRDFCEMYLECSGGDCEQTCNAKTCKLNCRGEQCRKQQCKNEVEMCNMHCNAIDCTQTCDAVTCHITRTWLTSPQGRVTCSGNGKYCGSLMSSLDSYPLTQGIFSTDDGGDKRCTCSKCLRGFCSSSDSYRSNFISSAPSTASQGFSTQISTVQRKDKSHTWDHLQSSSSSPLSLLSPSPLPSSSISSSSSGAEATTTAESESISTKSSASSSLQAAASSSPPSSIWTSTLEANGSVSKLDHLQSSSSSPLSLLSPSPLPSSSISSSSSRAEATTTAESESISTKSSASSSLQAAASSSPPSSIWTSTLEVLKNLANGSVSKLGEIDSRRNNSLKEAMRVFEDFIDNFMNITTPIKGQLNDGGEETRRESIFKVAVAFEEFALNYGKYHLNGTNPSAAITSQTMVLGIQIGYRHDATDFFLKGEEWEVSINISSDDFAEKGSVIVGCVYKDLHELLLRNQSTRKETNTSRYVNTRIMTAAMNPKPEKLRRDAILKFRNLQVVKEEQHCMFWSGFKNSPDGFSEEGCHVDHSRSNSEETVCSCNHLTHFAVLVDFSGSTKLSENDVAILEIITYVGLSLSIIGILSTIILYSFLTDVRQPLSQIRVSLAVALGAGQIFFLSGINATENKAVCVIVAVIMQYLLMAAFCWMLVEGIYLYLFVVKVYNINTKMHMYHVMSWGFPLVMVAISLCIAAGKEGIQSYTSDKFCWISSANNLIWIFVTFVIAIEVINILILTRVIREMTRMQPTGDQQSQQLRVGIRACMVMIPLLGITWLFGLLSPLHKAFSYIFTILNSTQGFLIFVLHCVRNSQIRERFKRKVNRVFPSTNNGNSAKRSSQVNPSDVGDTCVAELQSFNEFEVEKHSA